MAKKSKKKEIGPVKIKKLRTNYELRYDFLPVLTNFIKKLPKEHRSYRVDNIMTPDGYKDEWVRIIREVQMGNIISFMVDNNIPFVFENLLPEELNHLRSEYRKRQVRIKEAIKVKEADLNFDDMDFSFMKIQPYDYQKQAVKFFEINNGKSILGDQPGVGKAMDLDSLISTPGGWVRMGDIKVGDEVHDRFGGTSIVTGVYPQGKKKLYKVTFNDNSSANCCIEHLWRVRDKNRRQRNGGWTIKSTQEILDSGINNKISPSRSKTNRNPSLKWEIPVADAVYFPESKFIIEPYILGALIGDGYICGETVEISIPDHQLQIKENIESKLPDEFKLYEDRTAACPQYRFTRSHSVGENILKSEIKRLKLNVKSGCKFIPVSYLKSSIKQRTELLEGLMDTDGSCDRNRTNYHTTSKKLASDVVELVQSLGGIAKINIYNRDSENKSTEYRVNIKTPFCPFTLEDKSNQWAPIKKNRISRYISKIESLDTEVEQQCISVSCSDHTYLTNNYIVTHNTLPAIAYAAKHSLKTLVICPASLKLNWRKEIHKFSNEKAHVYKYKPTKKSGKVNHEKEDSLFHVINYESIQTYIKLEYKHTCKGRIIVPGKGSQICGCEIIDLKKKHSKCEDCKNSNSFKTRINGLAFLSDKGGAYIDPDEYDLVVIDEFHRIKDTKTDWTKIIKKAFRDTVDKKILISGTAIKSRPKELFSGLNFLYPDVWNSFHDYAVRYCAAYEGKFGWDYDGASNLEELFGRISPFFLRRLKKDVLEQLPEKTYTDIQIELTPTERREYNKLIKEMKKVVNDDGSEEEKEQSFLEKVHNLKQFTGAVKLDRIIKDNVVEDITGNGEKLVVMSDYQSLAEELYDTFSNKSVIHTGSMSQEDKQDSVEKFQEDKKVKLFSGMIGASGVGITLTEASTLIFLGYAWTPADMEQAEDRIHRATTTHDNIHIIRYVVIDTIDEDIVELLEGKGQVVSKVLDNKDYNKKIRVSNESIMSQLISKLLDD